MSVLGWGGRARAPRHTDALRVAPSLRVCPHAPPWAPSCLGRVAAMKPHHHTRQVHQGTHTHAKRQPQGRVVHGRGSRTSPRPAPSFRQPAGSQPAGRPYSQGLPLGGLSQTLKQACSRKFSRSAMCVQRFDDSLSSAIHITYRISLRSSSLQ